MNRRIGFSIFPGWKEIKENQIELVKKARNLGYSDIFFGIGPGTHWKTEVIEAFEIAKDILKYAEDYYTFVDINPEILNKIGCNPKDISKITKIGFKGVRVDYGFNKEEIVEISKQANVEINPMEISEEEINYIIKNADPEKIQATHNYYPVKYSGMSLDFFDRINRKFKEYGINIGAFISHPKYKLRTTLEMLRDIEPFDSSNFLFKFVDRVIIGDPIPDDKSLNDIANIVKSEITQIRINLLAHDEEVEKFLTSDFIVDEYKDIGITCHGRYKYNKKCLTKIFKKGVAISGNDLMVFTKKGGIGEFSLIGEIDDINLEILRRSKKIKVIPK
ncbi:MupG family TIM beta-alpha barrel fold protein [Acidianus manzaensis]|uniref:6-phospho-N-acetylmuramidase N-terminal domain-containing protein n=1 Tax=Acidianus manzaensis TaxID=282676 RepID=A0A1W6JZ25_9CREN|nr:MupG family TIM beta-alpha barrel fold protein [Acidianus manzaensis]ARM75460.1 hypothetical protein B6F84_05065 [Acidianus manzaensis]